MTDVRLWWLIASGSVYNQTWQGVPGIGAVEPFTKAGDKNPMGIKYRDLKQRKGNQYQNPQPRKSRGRGTSGRPVMCFKNCGSRGRRHSPGRRTWTSMLKFSVLKERELYTKHTVLRASQMASDLLQARGHAGGSRKTHTPIVPQEIQVLVIWRRQSGTEEQIVSGWGYA